MNQDTDPKVVRMKKLAEIEAAGVEAFPARWPVTHSAAEALAAYAENEPVGVRVAGRIVSVRGHGKTTFLHIEDRSGRVQAYLRRDDLGEAVFETVARLDLGDFLGVAGPLMRTRTDTSPT